ncbi:dihydrofolate reductase family protein [Fibrella sp. WM1]|uniref:dihydrofolate reductase family protein n=1 Tax=Fibrella musci TaxID=3242485 RepID=UPI003520EAF1
MPALKLSVYIATSLDGFIARPNGDIDWLTDPAFTIPNEDFGYQTFIDSIDALVMGRGTYEKVVTFPEWPYPKRVFVLSRTLTNVSDAFRDKVELLSLSPRELVTYLTGRGYRHIYLDGGQTIQQFLGDGLVDELTITRIPVLLGEGIPLFGGTGSDIPLQHLRTTTYPNGFVQSVYRRA